MEKKEDLRIKKTRKLLTLALFELLEKTPFEKVSVVDICEKAMVHRATFYAHFEDKYHLITYIINEIMEDLFNKTVAVTNINSIKEIYLTLIKVTLDYIEKNETTFNAILNNNSTESIFGIVLNATKRSILYFIDKFKIKKDLVIPFDVFLDFFSGGIANLALNYIKHSKKYSTDKLITYLDTMFDEKIFINLKDHK